MPWAEASFSTDWPTITFTVTGNVAYNEGTGTFTLSDTGLVFVTALLTRSSAFSLSNQIATLPSEYIPSVVRYVSGTDIGAFTSGTAAGCVMQINTNGQVNDRGSAASESGFTHYYSGVYIL